MESKELLKISQTNIYRRLQKKNLKDFIDHSN